MDKRAREVATQIPDSSKKLSAYAFIIEHHLKRTDPAFRKWWEQNQKAKEEAAKKRGNNN